jgi:hypothetical protein
MQEISGGGTGYETLADIHTRFNNTAAYVETGHPDAFKALLALRSRPWAI